MHEKPEISLDRPFWVADWKVEPSLGRLSRAEMSVKIEPKVMTVLVCLAQSAGDVITREQLETAAWEGMVVGYDSLASTIIKLRKAFEDDSRNPRIIETVPKRGYRLIAPVATEETNLAGPNDAMASPAFSQDRAKGKTNASFTTSSLPPAKRLARWATRLRTTQVAQVAVALSVALTAGAAISYFSLQNFAGKDQAITVAVLPFKNMSNDPQQEYFSDGLTADLITDLSKLSALSVIARNTVFSYRTKHVDIRKIARELGVQYVVEGSVRKAGNTVRISARLIDAKSGTNLWADRFDGSLDDVFELQDRVTSKIVESLKLTLTDSERIQLIHKYTNNVEAYDHFLRGWQYFWNMSREGNQIARVSYHKAIKLDPEFARAYANLALTYTYEYLNGWSDNQDLTLSKANEYANKAVELDDKLPQVYWVLGIVQIHSRQYKDALETARFALTLNHNYADGYGMLATALNYAGQPKQALVEMNRAILLNPGHPSIYLVVRGEIYFNLRNYKKAIGDFTAALNRNPEAQEPRLWLAAAYVYNGQLEDAKWQIQQQLFADPELTLAKFDQAIPLNDPTQRKHLIDGLFRAGLK